MSQKERIKTEIDICKALILAFLTLYLEHLVSLLLIMKKLIYGRV